MVARRARAGGTGTHRRHRGAATAAHAGRRSAGRLVDRAGANRAAALWRITNKGGIAMTITFRLRVSLTAWLVALALAGPAAAQQPPRLDVHGDPLPPGAL